MNVDIPISRINLACYKKVRYIENMMSARFHYILFYKPYGVLSQFTHEHGHPSLKDFGPFPANVYPVGRLDADSEGLLLLTDDNRVKHRMSSPSFGHERTYLAQVERIPTDAVCGQLESGVVIEGKLTLPARVRRLNHEPKIPERSTPIRFRKTVPTAWIELAMREGRNRQVRKMTAAVGHPTLRLIRTHIGFLSLEGLHPGESRSLNNRELIHLRSLVDTSNKL
jgi:23S rRNA pseudouridine2457 synthase